MGGGGGDPEVTPEAGREGGWGAPGGSEGGGGRAGGGEGGRGPQGGEDKVVK